MRVGQTVGNSRFVPLLFSVGEKKWYEMMLSSLGEHVRPGRLKSMILLMNTSVGWCSEQKNITSREKTPNMLY